MIDPSWKYVTVPSGQDVDGIKELTAAEAMLAPWDFCGEGAIKEDDVFTYVLDAIAAGTCKL